MDAKNFLKRQQKKNGNRGEMFLNDFKSSIIVLWGWNWKERDLKDLRFEKTPLLILLHSSILTPCRSVDVTPLLRKLPNMSEPQKIVGLSRIRN